MNSKGFWFFLMAGAIGLWVVVLLAAILVPSVSIRRLSKALIIEPFQTILLITNYVSPKCPATYPQYLRCFVLTQSLFLPSAICLFKSHLPVLL